MFILIYVCCSEPVCKVSSGHWASYKQENKMPRKLYTMISPTFRVDVINELVDNFGKCLKWSSQQAFAFVCQVRKAWAYLLMELLAIPSLSNPLIVRNRSSYPAVLEITCSSKIGVCHHLSWLSTSPHWHTQAICTHLHVPFCAHTIRRHHSAHHPGCRLETKV